MIALVTFTGVVSGKEVRFSAGEKIPAGAVKELGLADRPELAGKE